MVEIQGICKSYGSQEILKDRKLECGPCECGLLYTSMIVDAFVEAEFEGGRHGMRVEMISDI